MKDRKRLRFAYFWTGKAFLFSLLAISLAALSSCKSTSGYAPGKPCEISFRDYRNQTHMALHNESLSPRSKTYSQSTNQNTTKVISDDLMEVMVHRLEDLGFYEGAQSGNLPTTPIPGALAGISIRIDQQSKVLVRSATMPAKNLKNFNEMVQSFRQIYDGTFQAKSIDKKGKEVFKDPQNPREKKKGGGVQ